MVEALQTDIGVYLDALYPWSQSNVANDHGCLAQVTNHLLSAANCQTLIDCTKASADAVDHAFLAVVLQTNPVKVIVTRAGREVELSTLLVGDETRSWVTVTLWGAKAFWVESLALGDIVWCQNMRAHHYKKRSGLSSRWQSSMTRLSSAKTAAEVLDSNFTNKRDGLVKGFASARSMLSGCAVAALGQDFALRVQQLATWAQAQHGMLLDTASNSTADAKSMVQSALVTPVQAFTRDALVHVQGYIVQLDATTLLLEDKDSRLLIVVKGIDPAWFESVPDKQTVIIRFVVVEEPERNFQGDRATVRYVFHMQFRIRLVLTAHAIASRCTRSTTVCSAPEMSPSMVLAPAPAAERHQTGPPASSCAMECSIEEDITWHAGGGTITWSLPSSLSYSLTMLPWSYQINAVSHRMFCIE